MSWGRGLALPCNFVQDPEERGPASSPESCSRVSVAAATVPSHASLGLNKPETVTCSSGGWTPRQPFWFGAQSHGAAAAGLPAFCLPSRRAELTETLVRACVAPPVLSGIPVTGVGGRNLYICEVWGRIAFCHLLGNARSVLGFGGSGKSCGQETHRREAARSFADASDHRRPLCARGCPRNPLWERVSSGRAQFSEVSGNSTTIEGLGAPREAA